MSHVNLKSPRLRQTDDVNRRRNAVSRGATSEGSHGFQPTGRDATQMARRGATIDGSVRRMQLGTNSRTSHQFSLRDDVVFAELRTVG